MYKNNYFRSSFQSDMSRILKIYCRYIPLGENEPRNISTQKHSNHIHGSKENTFTCQFVNKKPVNHIYFSHMFSSNTCMNSYNNFLNLIFYQFISKGLLMHKQIYKFELPTQRVNFLSPNNHNLILKRTYTSESDRLSAGCPQRQRIKDYKKRKSKLPPLCKACPREFKLKKNTSLFGRLWSKLSFGNSSRVTKKKVKVCNISKKNHEKSDAKEKKKPPMVAQSAACAAECDLRKTDSSSTCQMKPNTLHSESKLECPEPKLICSKPKPLCPKLKPPCPKSKPPCAKPKPVCVEPKPVCVEPKPVCVEPKPVCVELKPVCVEPKPVCVVPKPVCVVPKPVCAVPKLVCAVPKQMCVKPKPVCVESERPCIELERPCIELERPCIELEPAASAEPKLPSAEPKPPSAEPKPPSAEPKPPSAEPKLPSAEPKLPSAEPKLPSAEPKLPSAEPKLPSAKPKLPSAEPEPLYFEPQIPCIELQVPCVELQPPSLEVTLPRSKPNPPAPVPKEVSPKAKPKNIAPNMDEKMAALCKKYNLDDIWLSDNVSSEDTRLKRNPKDKIIPCIQQNSEPEGEKGLSKTSKKKSLKNSDIPSKQKKIKQKESNNKPNNSGKVKENPELYTLPLIAQGREDQEEFEESLSSTDSVAENDQNQSKPIKKPREIQNEVNEINDSNEYNPKMKFDLEKKVEKFMESQHPEGNKPYKQYSVYNNDEDDYVSEYRTSRRNMNSKFTMATTNKNPKITQRYEETGSDDVPCYKTAKTTQRHEETGSDDVPYYKSNAIELKSSRSGSFKHIINSASPEDSEIDCPQQSFKHNAIALTPTKRKMDSAETASHTVEIDIISEPLQPLTKRQLSNSNYESDMISSRIDDPNRMQQKNLPKNIRDSNNRSDVNVTDDNIRSVRSKRYDPEFSTIKKPEDESYQKPCIKIKPSQIPSNSMEELEGDNYQIQCIKMKPSQIPMKQNIHNSETSNKAHDKQYETDNHVEATEPLQHYRYRPADITRALKTAEKHNTSHAVSAPVDGINRNKNSYDSDRHPQTANNYSQDREQTKITMKPVQKDLPIRQLKTIPSTPSQLDVDIDSKTSTQYINPEIHTNRGVAGLGTERSPDESSNALNEILSCKFDITQDEVAKKSMYKTSTEEENKHYQLCLTLSECNVRSDTDLSKDSQAKSHNADNNQRSDIKTESVEASPTDRNSRSIINETKTTQDRIRNFTTSAHQKIKDAEMKFEVNNIKKSIDMVINRSVHDSSMVLPKLDELQNDVKVATDNKHASNIEVLKQYSSDLNDINESTNENTELKECVVALKEFKSRYSHKKSDDFKHLNYLLESKTGGCSGNIINKNQTIYKSGKSEEDNSDTLNQNYSSILESVLRSYGIYNANTICNILETNDNYKNFQDMEVKYNIENRSYGETAQKPVVPEDVLIDQQKIPQQISTNSDRGDSVKHIKNKKLHKVIHKGQTHKNTMPLKRKKQKAKMNEQATQYVVDSTMLENFIKLIKKDLVDQNAFKKCAKSCCHCNQTDSDNEKNSTKKDRIPVSYVKGNKKIKLEVPSEISKHFGQMEDRFKIISPCDIDNAEKLHILLSHKAQEFSKVMFELVKVFSSYKSSNEVLNQEDTLKYLQKHQCRIESLKDTVKSLQDAIGKYFMHCNKSSADSTEDFIYNIVEAEMSPYSRESGTTNNATLKKSNMPVYSKASDTTDSSVLPNTTEQLNMNQRNNIHAKIKHWQENENEDEFRKTLLDLVHLLSHSDTEKEIKCDANRTKLQRQP